MDQELTPEGPHHWWQEGLIQHIWPPHPELLT